MSESVTWAEIGSGDVVFHGEAAQCARLCAEMVGVVLGVHAGTPDGRRIARCLGDRGRSGNAGVLRAFRYRWAAGRLRGYGRAWGRSRRRGTKPRCAEQSGGAVSVGRRRDSGPRGAAGGCRADRPDARGPGAPRARRRAGRAASRAGGSSGAIWPVTAGTWSSVPGPCSSRWAGVV